MALVSTYTRSGEDALRRFLGPSQSLRAVRQPDPHATRELTAPLSMCWSIRPDLGLRGTWHSRTST